MFKRTPPVAARYAVAVLALALATVVRFALMPLLGLTVPFIIYFPTVVLCAWFGGLKPGLLSTALAGLIAWYAFIPPQYFFIKTVGPAALPQLIFFLLGGTLISLLAENLHRARRRIEESERREREQRERLRITLASIGDAVIATDADGQVIFMNHVAEALTGWKQQEASGQPIEAVLKILNEQSRATVENPALRAMREGLITGLANHSVLIARDGREIPIDDSAAPIRDADGTLRGAVLIFRDVAERRLAEDMFRLAVEASPAAMIMVDDAGRIVLVNSQTERLFGYSRRELIGQQIEMLVPERFRRVHPDYRTSFAASPQARPMGAGRDLYGLRKDGRDVPIEIGLNPINMRGKTVVLSSIVDIAARKQQEQERAALLKSEQAAREHAEAASRAKDEFVAIVSHELRGPLTAILGWIQLLRTAKFSETEMARGLETLERNAKVQAQLVDDLLDISRAITGKLALNVRSVEISQIVSIAVDSIRTAAEAKSIHLGVELDPRAGWVSGDPDRLQQIIWNLVSNAVKFTPRNGRVGVSVERRDSVAQIVVSDSGIGITPEFLPQVFDRFSQADASGERKQSGLGLGLSIVKHLVELHGGTIRAESAGAGLGATFTVTLPLTAHKHSAELGTPSAVEH
jgi:hypothetical protein